MDLAGELSPQQHAAVVHEGSPSLVLAGAGSGKTRVLTYRIAHLVKNRRVPPRRIFAVTFTNRAAAEMRSRAERLLGDDCEGLWLSTFHSACARLLRMYGERIGVGRDFLIFDDRDSQDVIKSCMEHLKIPEKLFPPRSIATCIDGAKNRGESAAAFQRRDLDFVEEKAAQVYHLYDKALRAQNALDFGDLIVRAAELFKEGTPGADDLAARFTHLLVDEFQDTNDAQYRLLRRMARAGAEVCVVGDDDQSIYGWRGARVQNILEFQEHFAGTTVLPLGHNYRCSGTIVRAAAAIVGNNRHRLGKRIWTDNHDGERPFYVRCRDERDEAGLVGDRILQLCLEEGHSYGEIAAFYRTNAQSRVVEDALRVRGIPHVVVGGVRFYERKEVRDVLGYLRLIVNPRSDVDFRRVIGVPPRGIGAVTVKKIEVQAQQSGSTMWESAKTMVATQTLGRSGAKVGGFLDLLDRLKIETRDVSVGEAVKRVLDATGYEDMLREQRSVEARSRLENIGELLSAAVDYDEQVEDATLATFLEGTALVSDIDLAPERSEAVQLITLHSVKGLEFRAVFLLGLEEGTLPHSRSADGEWELEEERRLCYVGITRAKELLWLSSAASRRLFGDTKALRESRFVEELGEHIDRTSRVFEEIADPDVTFWGGRPRHTPSARPPRRRRRDEFDQRAEDRWSSATVVYDDVDQRTGNDHDLAPEGPRPGMRVAHEHFGEGEIQAIDGGKMTVVFRDGARRRIVAKYLRILGY